MPLVKRKRTIRGALRDIAIAPFAFLLAGMVLRWKLLVVIVVLMFFTMWMNGERLADLAPSKEFVYGILGVIALVALAAVPLAIRDLFSNGGYEIVWQGSEETIEAAREFARMLIREDYQKCYEHFSEGLKAKLSYGQFVVSMKDLTDKLGAAVSIEQVTETPIPQHVFADPSYDTEIDAITQIQFAHENRHGSLLTLYQNSRDSFHIVTFRHAACEIQPSPSQA